jgi:hypothetical protein
MTRARSSRLVAAAMGCVAAMMVACIAVDLRAAPTASPLHAASTAAPGDKAKPCAPGGEPSPNSPDCRQAHAADRMVELTRHLAEAAWIQALILLVQTVALVGTLYVAFRSTNAAKRSADAAVAAQRPWLKLDAQIASDLVQHGPNGARLEFRLRLDCLGNSPATNVQAWASMVCGGKAAPLQQAVNKAQPRMPGYGFSIFPGDGRQEPLFGSLLPGEISAALSAAMAQHHVFVGVVFFVTYQFAGGRGETRKAFEVTSPGVMESINLRALPVASGSLSLKSRPVEDVAA